MKYPKRIEIELSAKCNLQCPYCPRRFLSLSDGFMKFDLFKKIIDELSTNPKTIIVLHRRGESLLHPDFVSICNYISKKFNEIQIASNATVLTTDKAYSIINSVTFISFSIDVPRLFNKYRYPADYKKVENNILNFLKLNNKKIKTQVSLVKTNSHNKSDFELFKKIWKDKVDFVRIYEQHSSDGNFGSLQNKRINRQPCVMPFYEMLVYYDGTLGRCNHDWDSNDIGDLNKNSISDIWTNQFYNNLRYQHKTLEITDKVCKNCDSWYPEIGKQGTGETIKNEKN